MKDDKFKGAPGFENKGVVSGTSADAIKGSALDKAQGLIESEGLSHLENLAAGLDKKVAENLAKAKDAADKAKQAAAIGKQLTSGTSGYQHQIGGVNGVIPSQNTGISNNSINSTDSPKVSNAKAIAKHSIFGVNHLVDITIVVEGKDIPHFKSFQLNQTIKGHHSFTLVLAHDALGEAETYHMEQAQDLLGKRLLAMFNLKNIKEKPERDFTGIITRVSFGQDHGSRGTIILRGYSPTILLDAAPHIQSFGGSNVMPLNSIVQKILDEGYSFGGKFKSSIKLKEKTNLSYSCQYNETPYNYLARMAEAYGEQFFYDGDILHFGDIPKGEAPIQLVYGRDVENIDISIQTCHVNRQLYGYNSLNHENISAAGDTKLGVKGTLAKVGYQKSESTFISPSLQMAPMKASTNQDITQAQKAVIGSEGINVFEVKGTTTVPFLYPGCVVELDMLSPGSKQTSHFTTMMITEISHSVDTLGKYTGSFCAVDAETGFIPRIEFTNPIVEQQVATVISNTDPQNKGRVQVRFDWQINGETTEWIRVMTPDAGSSDKVGSNRGFMAIPEVGDQVMVSFTANHPDRPYVLGGLFTGASGAGGGAGNNVKSLSSKSGHSLELNDAQGITLKDKSNKNFFILDGTNAIVAVAGDSITLTNEKSIIMMKDNKITINADFIEVVGNMQLTNSSGSASQMFTSIGASIITQGITLITQSTINNITGDSIAVSSLNYKLEASTEAVIDGGIVKINS